MTDSFPVWSPDGGRIAFVRGEEVWIVEVGPGAVPRRITAGAEAHVLAWEPGGAALVVSGLFGTGAMHVRRVSPPSGTSELLKPQLVLGDRHANGYVSLSRDGRFLAADITELKGKPLDQLDRLLVRLNHDHPRHLRERLAVKVTLTSRNVPFLSASFRYFLSCGVQFRRSGQVPCSFLVPSTLGSQPRAIRRVVATLGGLHVTDPDLPDALLRRERRAHRLRFLAGLQDRQGPHGACASCKTRSTRHVCPVAVACNGGQVPAFHCDVNRLLARRRATFVARASSLTAPSNHVAIRGQL